MKDSFAANDVASKDMTNKSYDVDAPLSIGPDGRARVDFTASDAKPAVTLVHPFEWQHVFIPLLPAKPFNATIEAARSGKSWSCVTSSGKRC